MVRNKISSTMNSDQKHINEMDPHPSIWDRQCILGRPNGVMGHDEAVMESQSFYLLDKNWGVTQGATNSEITNLTY